MLQKVLSVILACRTYPFQLWVRHIKQTFVSNLYSFSTCDHTFFNGPKTPTSNGCSRCVVWGGNVNTVTLCSFAFSTSCRVTCDWWPSRNSMTGPVWSMSSTAGRKSFWNHSKKLDASIHPDWDREYKVPLGPPLICLCWWYFPLYRMYGGNFSPIAEPQKRIVTNSLPLPPPVSWTAFSPFRASILREATLVHILVLLQFHSRLPLSLGDSWSRLYFENSF